MKYKPKKGFYDLSNKPETLSKKEHQQIQETQMMLMRVEKRKEEYMKDKAAWQMAQEMSAKLQQIILKHYQVD